MTKQEKAETKAALLAAERDAWARHKATSAQAAVRNREASQRVGCGDVVVLRLSSANALLKKWKAEAARDRLWARKAQASGGEQNLMLANQYAFEAIVRREYAEELRLLLASATEASAAAQPQR